jgi:hypothetical protein
MIDFLYKIGQLQNIINRETLYFFEFATVNQSYSVGNRLKAWETPNLCKKHNTLINSVSGVIMRYGIAASFILRC